MYNHFFRILSVPISNPTSSNDVGNQQFYELLVIIVCWISLITICFCCLGCSYLSCYTEYNTGSENVSLNIAQTERYNESDHAGTLITNDLSEREMCTNCLEACLVPNPFSSHFNDFAKLPLCSICSATTVSCPFCNTTTTLNSTSECPCGISIDMHKMALFAQSSYFPKVERLFFRCANSQGEREHLIKVIEMLCAASVVSDFSKNGWDIMQSISLLLNSVLYGTLELKFHDRTS